MNTDIESLRRAMEKAAANMDFEEATLIRNRISLLRSGVDAEEAKLANTIGLTRQRPGNMGLGTDRQGVEPPPGWTRPKKPDPMTRGHKQPRRARKS